nr:RNA-directed DNA polymerase, eukaryota [Tanacetum cinerariifolium]
ADKAAPSFASAVKGVVNSQLSSSPALVLDDTCIVTRDLGYFVSCERIVWVDVEGVPLYAWSRNTFLKIGSKCGEVLDLEEGKDDFFAQKRICIKTKQEDNILEKFKILVKGKVFVVRAKELFIWSPTFTEVHETNVHSDNESSQGMGVNQMDTSPQENLEVKSDEEADKPWDFLWLVVRRILKVSLGVMERKKVSNEFVWSSMSLSDSNGMVRFKKKLQHLKKEIRSLVMERKKQNMGYIYDIKSKLHELDVSIDQGGANADILASRGILVDGEWVSDPIRVKEEFRLHFAKRFEEPAVNRGKISFQFPTRLNSDQASDLERPVSCDEIRQAVWGCGEDKSPGPDGFTFEFFRKFWDLIGSNFCVAVKWFFDHSSFSRGCNSSFVALIPKNSDPKFVTDYRPTSLIGCLYKVVTKILALRLLAIISDVQTAFVPGRQILDGPFIINELLAWCKHYKHQAMVFKVDFAKAYDSVRWDYLMDVLKSFGFGDKWCGWIKGSLLASMASVQWIPYG